MPASDHAILGASSATRWINCAGSVNAIAGLPTKDRDNTSEYADEGTAAHSLGEYILKRFGFDKSAHEFLGKRVKGELGSYEVDYEMADAIDVWTETASRHFGRLGDPEMLIEARVQPLPDREDLFGTADTILIGETELVVIDYKHGKGIVVESDWNDQMMYYALGALMLAIAQGRTIETVTLIIVQPRAIHADGPVREWTIPVEVLVEFAGILRGAADRTKEPDAPLKAGPWCRKNFCPKAAKGCKALRALAHSVAATDFDDLPELPAKPDAADLKPHVRLPDPTDADEVGRAMQIVPLLDYWAREVQGYAEKLLERGHHVPGQKLVRKRANRQWLDPDGVEKKLRDKRVKVDDAYTKKLRSPAQIEKLPNVGKDWVSKYAHKPEGGLTIAADTDRRPGVLPESLTDFDELPPEELPSEASERSNNDIGE